MKTGIISDFIENIEATNEQRPIISVRPSDKVMAMLDFMAKISEKNYAQSFSQLVSSELIYIVNAIKIPDILLDAAEKVFLSGKDGFQKGSALEYLYKNGYIDYKLPPFKAKVMLMTALLKK
jgi:hypothetical protein